MPPSPEFDEKHLVETYKGLITLSAAALKATMLLNGGAAIALLAMLERTKQLPPANLRLPLMWFLGGLVLGGVTHGLAYVTQLALYNESLLGGPTPWYRNHRIYLYISIVLCFGSCATFAVGSYLAANVIGGLPPA